MRKLVSYILALAVVALLGNCGASKKEVNITEDEKQTFTAVGNDTVTIGSEESNYEIIIIEPGFNRWLLSIAQPRGYYTQSYMETRNKIFVVEWNNRVLMPLQYSPLLYEMQINYDLFTDYGYEVNYQLYNYFIYFQRKYKQRLGPFLPRI